LTVINKIRKKTVRNKPLQQALIGLFFLRNLKKFTNIVDKYE